jgi:hypothetical protein
MDQWKGRKWTIGPQESMGWIDAFDRRGGPGGGSRHQHIRGGVGRDPLSPGISAASASRRSGSRDGLLRARAPPAELPVARQSRS